MSRLTELLTQNHALYDMQIEAEKEACRRSLSYFVQQSWRHMDPAPYQHGWHIDAISEHLEAVSLGQISKILINIPPRHMKTLLASVAWQVWTWTLPVTLLKGPQVTFLCGSYNSTKAQEDGIKARKLIRSEWFQERWGDYVEISKYVDNAERFETTRNGHRISVGIPESLGKGGIIRMLDDPHKTSEVESDTERERVLQNYRETWSTRSNDPTGGAEVMIMQRQAGNDLSDWVLSEGGWEHLMLPLEYEPSRHCTTSIGWQDPRGLDDETGELLGDLDDKGNVVPGSDLEERHGEPIWPERYPRWWCREQEKKVGPFAFAGQYQQAPAPRGGGFIKAEWWRLWEKQLYPSVDLVVVSVDGAFTEKTANDPSAIQVWGRFALREIKEPQFLLLWAWVGRCSTHDLIERVRRACQGDWRGLIGDDVPLSDGGTPADVLLVENKANGRPIAEEIVRLYGKRRWSTRLITPTGDKLSRLLSVQHLFSGLRTFNGEVSPGQVWAPDTTWAQSVIDEVANFPKAGHDDQTDAATQALWWMRTAGGAQTAEEAQDEWEQQNRYQKPRRRLYPA